MRFTIEDAAAYKKAVNTVISLCSRRVTLPSDQCVRIRAEQSYVTLASQEEGVHSIEVRVLANVAQEGTVYVLASSLAGLTKKLGAKSIVSVSSDNGQLCYRVAGLGRIGEALYHRQEAPRELDVKGLKMVLSNDGDLLTVMKAIPATALTNRNVLVTKRGDTVSTYSQFSETGYLRHTVKGAILSDFSVHLPLKAVKVIGSIRGPADFLAADRTIQVQGDDCSFTCKGDSLLSKSHLVVDKLISLDYEGSALLNHGELSAALQWQSHGCPIGQTVNLSERDGSLTVSTNNKDREPAIIGCESIAAWKDSQYSLSGLQAALKAVGAIHKDNLTEGGVRLHQRTYMVGDMPIGILTLTTSSETIETTALLYEQAV